MAKNCKAPTPGIRGLTQVNAGIICVVCLLKSACQGAYLQQVINKVTDRGGETNVIDSTW